MNKKRRWIIKLVAATLSAALFCTIAGLGALDYPDTVLSDFLYQHESVTDGEIKVIGMDQKAIDELGPMPGPRSYMAKAIEYLNRDPENRPAVIAIDVLYDAPSSNPEDDAALIKACKEAGNVVLAGFATIGSEVVVEENGDFRMDREAVRNWSEPIEDLLDVTSLGHINAMEDTDAILRHAILGIDVPGKGFVYSMPRVVYEMYCDYNGITPNPLPKTSTNLNRYYVNFTKKGGGYYERISFADLVKGMEELENQTEETDSKKKGLSFKGKIVYIGPYTVGLGDYYFTAVDHAAPMYGVEWMANLTDNFIDGFYPRHASQMLQLVLLFFICFGALLFFYDRHVIHAVAAEVGAVVLWIVFCLIAYRCRIVLHVLWVPLFVTVLFIASVALNYLRAAREKRRVQNTFGHYVDPSIMNTLLEQGPSALELGGKMYDIAVLFVDVRGFTTMSENMDPPTVVEIVNRYLTLTTECIIKNHGVLDKFVGDCTMAFWNAPIAQEDPVYLACCAAMDMVEGSKALGEELQKRFGRSVSFGIGVNWGPAVVGNIGAPKRMDYTAIGDTVNTSARLEANAPGGQILISRAVADQLGDRAECTSLGSTIKLKGKAEGFEILRLDSLKRE